MEITELIEKLQKVVDKLSKAQPNEDEWWDNVFIQYGDKSMEIDNITLSGFNVKEETNNKTSYVGCILNLKDEVCEVPKLNEKFFVNHLDSKTKTIHVATLLDIEEEI